MSADRDRGGSAATAMNPNDVLTVSEVAKHLRCSKTHVCKVIRGKVPGVAPLPAIRIGRRKLVRRSTLERWKNENESIYTENSGNILEQFPENDAAGRTEGGFHA